MLVFDVLGGPQCWMSYNAALRAARLGYLAARRAWIVDQAPGIEAVDASIARGGLALLGQGAP